MLRYANRDVIHANRRLVYFPASEEARRECLGLGP